MPRALAYRGGMSHRTVLAVALAAVLVAGTGSSIASAQPIGTPSAPKPAPLALDAPAATQPAASVYSKLRVTGYAEGWTTKAQLTASAKALTTVSVDGVNITRDGSGITAVTPEVQTQLKRARAAGKRAELLVGNFDDRISDFSPEIATRLLDSPTHIRSVVADLVAEVKKHRWDGITVDLESLDATNTAGLSRLVTQLDAALAAVSAKKTLSIALMATTSSYARLGYDLAVLNHHADNIVLMAYDQHGPWEDAPGPIGGYSYVKKTLAPLIRAVTDSRIQLGIAGYGYSWPTDGSEGEAYSPRQARALVKKDGAKAIWSSTYREWHATLDDGTILWWSDARAMTTRTRLAASLGLGGIAVWSLTLTDPLK